MNDKYLTKYEDYSDMSDIQDKVERVQNRIVYDVSRYAQGNLFKGKISKDINNLRRERKQRDGTRYTIDTINRFLKDWQKYIMHIGIFSHSYCNHYNYGIGISIRLAPRIIADTGDDLDKLRDIIKQYRSDYVQIKLYIKFTSQSKIWMNLKINDSPSRINDLANEEIETAHWQGRIPENKDIISALLKLSSNRERKLFIEQLE